jgi:L-methionine (R)-S-oxide reductase
MERSGAYATLLLQAKGLLEVESNNIANMANLCALVKETFGFWWVGYYINSDQELILGPFQGPVACTRIQKGRGVCGKSFQDAQSMIVDDVHQFPDHIACSAASNSEIVIPVIVNDKVVAILDIDSTKFSDFTDVDQKALEQLNDILAKQW